MTFTLNLTAALFAASACASHVLSNDALLLRSEDVLYRPYAAVMTTGRLSRRQADDVSDVTVTDSTNTTGAVTLNADGSLNVTAWDEATNNACQKSLGTLRQSSNPSGTCVCYNLPSLDTETGVFEADLRLYKVSEPRGPFSGIAPEDVMVGLEYNGASVTPITADDMAGAGNGNVSDITRRDGGKPELMQSYLFVGQIDKDKMSENLTM